MIHPRICLCLGLTLSACGTPAPAGQNQRVAPPSEVRSQAAPEAPPAEPERDPGMIEEDVRDVLETPELDEPGEQLPGDDGLDARDDEIEDLEQAEPVVEDDEE